MDAGDSLARVQITTLESAGSLQLSGVDVALGQVISIVDLTAGNLTFTPVTDENGAGYDSFGFRVNDGTAYSASSYTMTVDVTAVNDPPANTVPGTQTVDEETTTAIAGISIADVDAAAGNVQVSLSVSNGTLTLAQTTGLSFTVGDGGANAVKPESFASM